MKNHGLCSSFFIEDLKSQSCLDDAAGGRMASLAQTWRTRRMDSADTLWDTFLKQAVSYLEFVPPNQPDGQCLYLLYEDWNYENCIAVLYIVPPDGDLDDRAVGRFHPAKLLARLEERRLNWGILTDGARWRLYSAKSSRPFEDYVELSLAEALGNRDEAEYGLFERFFHKDSFLPETPDAIATAESKAAAGVYICRLDRDRLQSEAVLEARVKKPFLCQVDETLQYLCNGFIQDTPKTGPEYTEDERAEIFESAVKLLYRCLFLFYAEARRLLPSDANKAEVYRQHGIRALCREAHAFRWGRRRDVDQYDLWQHLKGLIAAVNEGDPEYGVMGYNGGLFDDSEERFLGAHRLRNDFMARALYLMAYVEPLDNADEEYEIPYEDLEVRHLGELYENILEYTVMLADADRIRRRTRKGVELLLATEAVKQPGDALIRKGDVFFGASAFERKQTGSYYTPESLVRFLNRKSIVGPLRERFDAACRERFEAFLARANAGGGEESQCGAAQAAASLVDSFVWEEVLRFKVCDPAMGSGHFLVDASNQMAALVVRLLAEIPDVPGLRAEVSSDPNVWRRLVTRHCLYGVDLNPLAVTLAKLSLWLNCFASDHRLTFLDHHLRHGNSLIGIRFLAQLRRLPPRKKDKKQDDGQAPLFDYDAFGDALQRAAHTVAEIAAMAEDDTEKQKGAFEEAREETARRLRPLADLYTAYLMDGAMTPETYHLLFQALAKGRSGDVLTDPKLLLAFDRVQDLARRHHFFHFPLEFPDVFGEEDGGGFTATVGNPPWDIVKPNSQEFFSNYDPDFRSYDKQQANEAAERLMKEHPAIAEKWREYGASFEEQSAYFKEPGAYAALGKGDINTYKIFLERFFALLCPGGHMGIVTPSGLYTDAGTLPLRSLFFEQSQVQFLYCFENRWPTIFPAVDGRFKFILFAAVKGGMTRKFKTAFMEHDPERLPAIDAQAMEMTLEQVKKFSPDTFSIMEFNHQRDIKITEKIYGDWPLLGDKLEGTWNVSFRRELDMTNDSRLFKMIPTDCPLYEGKMIWLFDSHYENPRYWLDKRQIEEALGDSAWEGSCFRLGFRDVAASTNERTLIVSILPRVWYGHTMATVQPYHPEKMRGGPNEFSSIWLVCFLGSFCIDYLIRQKVTNHMSYHYMNSLPIPRNQDSLMWKTNSSLVCRAFRLLCVSDSFKSLWDSVFSIKWQSPEFWYPASSTIDTYGPSHECDIRRRLRDEAAKLTPEWGPHCGVHDRLPDRRDTGDRAQLRAEIDAYVAHLYGLNREDFAYILDTFPVLCRKEEQAFGEFKSKRKCLEEYDRIGGIL